MLVTLCYRQTLPCNAHTHTHIHSTFQNAIIVNSKTIYEYHAKKCKRKKWEETKKLHLKEKKTKKKPMEWRLTQLLFYNC